MNLDALLPDSSTSRYHGYDNSKHYFSIQMLHLTNFKTKAPKDPKTIFNPLYIILVSPTPKF